MDGVAIDIISNEFVFLERINIPHTQLVKENNYVLLSDAKLLNDRYISVNKFAYGSIYIYQYKFEY